MPIKVTVIGAGNVGATVLYGLDPAADAPSPLPDVAALLDDIVKTVQDRYLGLEALALASIRERDRAQSAEQQLNEGRWSRCFVRLENIAHHRSELLQASEVQVVVAKLGGIELPALHRRSKGRRASLIDVFGERVVEARLNLVCADGVEEVGQLGRCTEVRKVQSGEPDNIPSQVAVASTGD